MRAFKRAVQYSMNSYISVILLVVIFTVVFTVLMPLGYLLNLTGIAAGNLGDTQNGSITVFAEEDGFEIGVKGKTFSEDFIEELANQKSVKMQCYSESVPAYGSDLKIYQVSENTRLIKEAMYENYDYETAQDSTIIGVSDLNYYPSFRTQAYKITEGRAITEADAGQPVAVISDIVAMNNDISLGDKISYKIQDKDGVEVKLEVVGIHSDGDEFNGNAQGYAESMSQENLIFIPMGYLTSLVSGDSINQISFETIQASKSLELLKWMKEKQPEAMKDARVVNQNYQYLEKDSIITAQRNYYEVVMYAGYGTALAIFGLFVSYLISGRRKQFGILLSMGESKGSVVAQLLFELLIPFVISIPLGIIGTKVVLSKIPIPDLILQYIGSQPGFGSRDLIFALVMGVIMILCAVVMISIMIFTKSPKDLVRGRDAI